MRILIVDDDPKLRAFVSKGLEAHGMETSVASNGLEARAVLASLAHMPDLILLDVMMPGGDGMGLLEDLRRQGIEVPVIFVSAARAVEDRVRGLKLGADDYLVKPFEAMELLARIEALLRRAGNSAAPPSGTPGATRFEFDDVTVDTRKAEVVKAGVPVELSAKEFHLLRYFLEHRGATISRDELLQEVWGYEHTPSTRTVDVHVAWLRQKLEANPKTPQVILTVHGLGYKFVG